MFKGDIKNAQLGWYTFKTTRKNQLVILLVWRTKASNRQVIEHYEFMSANYFLESICGKYQYRSFFC